MDSFPGANITEKIGVTNLNEILLDQLCVCSGILLQIYYILKYVNMFERMGISTYIYKIVLEPYYKKLLGQIPTVLVK